MAELHKTDLQVYDGRGSPDVACWFEPIQVYSVTVMTHVKALQAGHSSQGTSEPITPISAYNIYCFLFVLCSYVSYCARIKTL